MLGSTPTSKSNSMFGNLFELSSNLVDFFNHISYNIDALKLSFEFAFFQKNCQKSFMFPKYFFCPQGIEFNQFILFCQKQSY